MNTYIKAAFDAARPELIDQVSKAKTEFLNAFGDWVHSSNRERLETLFMDAGRAKISSLFAATPQEAEEQHDIFETLIDSLETIGLADWITGKAQAVKAMKATINAILHGLAVGFGLAVKAVMGVAIPGVGWIGGSVAGPGVTFLLDSVFGSNQ